VPTEHREFMAQEDLELLRATPSGQLARRARTDSARRDKRTTRASSPPSTTTARALNLARWLWRRAETSLRTLRGTGLEPVTPSLSIRRIERWRLADTGESPWLSGFVTVAYVLSVSVGARKLDAARPDVRLRCAHSAPGHHGETAWLSRTVRAKCAVGARSALDRGDDHVARADDHRPRIIGREWKYCHGQPRLQSEREMAIRKPTSSRSLQPTANTRRCRTLA
jgi:hypothetical protein